MKELIATILIMASVISAQHLRWEYSYRGSSPDTVNNWNEALGLACGADGNIYAVGRTTNEDTSWYFTVASLDAQGNRRWMYQRVGTGRPGRASRNCADAVVPGPGGRIYAAGDISNAGLNNWDFAVVGLDTAGQEHWIYTYGTTMAGTEDAKALVYGPDGNLYAAGVSFSNQTDFTVISLDTAGHERWVYRKIGSGTSEALSVVFGPDGNIYAAGYVDSSQEEDAQIISLDTAGRERWCYQGLPGRISSLACDSRGDIVAAGTYSELHVASDFLVVSLDTAGRQRWLYRYNGPGNSTDGALSITAGPNGSVCAAGSSKGVGTSTDIVVVSLDTAGRERWLYRYDDPDHGGDMPCGSVVLQNGDLLIAGRCEFSVDTLFYSDVLVLCLDTAGAERWQAKRGGDTNQVNYPTAMVLGTDGNLYLSAVLNAFSQNAGFGVLSFVPEDGASEARLPPPCVKWSSPTVVRGVLKIEGSRQKAGDRDRTELLDVSGRRALGLHPGANDVHSLAPGVYFISEQALVNGRQRQAIRQKVVILR